MGSASPGSSTGSSTGDAQGGAMGSGGSSETMGSDKTDQAGSAGASAGGASSASGGMASHSDDKTVTGKLTKVSKSEVTITPKKGEPMTLKISDQTTVMVNGKDAKPSQLKQGQNVRASYQEQGTEEIAVKIESGSHMRQGHHGKAGSGSSSHMGSDTGGSSDSSGATK
jgi:hypothetical protein